jgi:outer membrane protein assembly factor BamD
LIEPGGHISAGFHASKAHFHLGVTGARTAPEKIGICMLLASPVLKSKILKRVGLGAMLLTLAMGTSACSSGLGSLLGGDSAPAPTGDITQSDDQAVASLYNAGLSNMNAGSYRNAVKKFAEVERLHPYSKWATKALLMQGFSNYQNNEYADAINACQRFISLHPGHQDIPYAYYLVALSQYEQIQDVTRDQSQTQVALDALDEVSRRFPSSKYAGDAKQKALLARDHLAGKEMEVGRYYMNHGSYLAGINRFKKVVTDYQTSSQTPEALYRLTEGYMALGIRAEAQTAAAVLGHNFPNSQWYKDAYTLVSSDGRAPVENKNSWISRAFNIL